MPPELTHNAWLLAFLCAAPAIVFMLRRYVTGPGRVFLATVVGWPLLLLAVNRAWELRVEFLPPNASDEQMRAATSDGANMLCMLLFGWVPSAMYAAAVFGIHRVVAGRSRVRDNPPMHRAGPAV